MQQKDLRNLRNHIQTLWAELQRLGDFDANTPYLRKILWFMIHMVEHEIQTYPKIQKNPVEEAVKKGTPQQRGKKGARRVLRRKNQGDMR